MDGANTHRASSMNLPSTFMKPTSQPPQSPLSHTLRGPFSNPNPNHPSFYDFDPTLPTPFSRLRFSPPPEPETNRGSMLDSGFRGYGFLSREREQSCNIDELLARLSLLENYAPPPGTRALIDSRPPRHRLNLNVYWSESDRVGHCVDGSNNLLKSDLYNRLLIQESLGVEDLRGLVVSLSKSQNGCRLLQRLMGGMREPEIDLIFSEVIHHVADLGTDPFGNYVVQKLVEVATEEQRNQILLMLTKTTLLFVSICLNVHGTRVVQKLLENLTSQEQISLVMAALSPGAVALTKDMNGHHVIQHCLKNFSNEDNKYLLNEVADNCMEIATDKSGCCVLQQCVEYSRGEPRERLITQIISNTLVLAEDPYGNYVVQHLLELRMHQITINLLRRLRGKYLAISCNKYGSNVVEKCLVESGEDGSSYVIMELLQSPNVSMLLLDPFGNFVIQSALTVSQGFVVNRLVHKALLDLIRMNYQMMRNNPYGKKILSWFDRRKAQLV